MLEEQWRQDATNLLNHSLDLLGLEKHRIASDNRLERSSDSSVLADRVSVDLAHVRAEERAQEVVS